MLYKVEDLVAHASRNEGMIEAIFRTLRSLAKRHARGPKSEMAGRDGVRFAIGDVKFCELHPRPFARPPYVGLWTPLGDDEIRALRHHQTRKGWSAVRDERELPTAVTIIEKAVDWAKARSSTGSR